MTDEATLIASLADTFAERSREDFLSEIERISELTESPIERVLGAAMLLSFKELPLYTFMVHAQIDLPHWESQEFICPQFKIGSYRVDFLIATHGGRPENSLVVECDGHAFHERTKEQARRDRRKDRYLQMAGYLVLRFTGSEIWASPITCADQVRAAVFARG